MPRRKPQNYLATHRKRWGLSQPDLGLLLGVSKSAISKYENDVSQLPLKRLIAAEIIFGVGAGDLLIAARDVVEDALARRALRLHDRLQDKTDAASLKKLELLNAIKDRVHEASHDL